MATQILVPIHTFPDGNSEKLAVHATTLARHLEGDIDALVLAPDFPRISNPLGNLLGDVPAMINDAKARCGARAQSLGAAFEREAAARNVAFRSTTTTCIPPAFGEAVASHGRYHDLIILGLGTDELAPATAESAIFSTGRPILLVPEQEDVPAPRHVMIAWDGSRAAARAVADARALFLHRAQTVSVATVIDEKRLSDEDQGARLADYLSRAGITAQLASVHGNGGPIAETLQDHAKNSGADMLVMGGFGHSRFRDFVLGGATRGILQNLRIPALISH